MKHSVPIDIVEPGDCPRHANRQSLLVIGRTPYNTLMLLIELPRAHRYLFRIAQETCLR